MTGFGTANAKTKKQKISRKGRQILETAIISHNKGDLKSAELLYLKAIKSGFIHETAFFNLGLIYKDTGREKEAFIMYGRAISINPNFTDAHTNLGILFREFGKLDQALASTLKSLELKPDNPGVHMNLGSIYKDLGNLDQALAATLKSLELSPNNPGVHINLGGIYKDLGKLDQALAATLKSLELKPDSPDAHMNLGMIYKDLDDLDQALASTLKSLQIKPNNADAHKCLGGIYKDLGDLDQALASTLKSLELKSDNPDAHINLGIIYKDLGEHDQALASTLKSLELKPYNPDAHMNLGIIYKNRGDLDQALASTLKSLELNSDNPGTLNNLKDVIKRISISPSNTKNFTQAYELLLNKSDISHRKLTRAFLQIFLPTIQKASIPDPIISESNEEFKALAADWRFQKSLRLIIPPNPEVENFLTRLRKELLADSINTGKITNQLKSFTESLASQCFLNEYVYALSQEEENYINKLIEMAANSEEACHQHLAIIGCYKPINEININPEYINSYPAPDYSSKELITAQFKEPHQEQKERFSFQEEHNANATDTISQRVQEMYEENPYPRFKYADHTPSEKAKPIHKTIETEATKRHLIFTEKIKSLTAKPKVLIAGCGTGNQVILASRYKNAAITAIDLSSSSLAYAIRKTKEYKMDNVTFKRMDLLKVAELGDIFDIIECGGVLHHMEKPSEGLSALTQQLKDGGFIKLGLYSEIAREVIVEARQTIQTLEIDSTPQGIKRFRKQVLDGEVEELLDLPNFASDFYSLSECRDLCFHVQEHRFTTESLKKLLDSHGLTFCGFMLPERIKKIYQEQYPEDGDMTSLSNWGIFEEEHPLTFAGMYQFWAQNAP